MTTTTYIVVEVYYKYGECSCTTFIDECSLKDYLVKALEDSGVIVCDEFRSLTLESLIELSIKVGADAIDNQGGWGIQYIVKGENITLWK